MPKAKKKPATATVTEPTPVADVLAASPIAQILASHEAKAQVEPDRPMPEPDPVAAFERQREREQAVTNHIERLARSLPAMAPVPAGFVNVDRYTEAGIRVNRSLDKGVAAIQFSEDWKASRSGLTSEIDTMEIRGFRYEPQRRQWERHDREQPGANIVDAKRLGADLAATRLGRTVG